MEKLKGYLQILVQKNLHIDVGIKINTTKPSLTGGILQELIFFVQILIVFHVAFTSIKKCCVIIAILISDTKCGIERNYFFVVLKTEVFGRELDSISGLVGVHIDL